jgi:hypothetical protein
MYRSSNYKFFGLLTLSLTGFLACNSSDTKDTSEENTSTELDSQAKVKAGKILDKLKANVHRDLPTKVNLAEEAVTTIERGLLQSWSNSWIEKDVEKFLSLLDDQATCPKFQVILDAPHRTVDDISEYSYNPQAATDITQNISEYVNAFTNIEHVGLDIHDAKVNGDQASLTVFFDLRGVDNNQMYRQDRGWMSLEIQIVDGDWKIKSLALAEQEVLSTKSTSFVDATEASGLSTIPLFPRLEALRRGGYAITVGDYDGDNDSDIYVGGWGRSNLYQNDGTGQFTDVTKSANIGKVDRVKAAAFTDLDNDGDKDLVLSRFIDDKSEDLLVYTNDGTGSFSTVEGAFTKDLSYDRAMPLTVADFNNDGFNDVYVGFPGARDFTYLDAKPNPLNTQGIFMNDGTGKFTDNTLASGLDVTPESRVGLAAYPHASVKADFDNDGRVDLMVADDRRGPSQVFKNDGTGQFTASVEDTGLRNNAWAMGVAVGDYDNDGLLDIYYSNIDFLAAKRIDSTLSDDDIQLFHGNRLFHNLGNGKFEDVTETAGVGWAGEAAAGSMWFDFDNDGDLDLYVLNGLWTGPGDQEISSLFNRAYASELLLEKTDIEKAKAPLDVDAISLRNPGFNNMIIQTLTHFSGDISQPTAKTSSKTPTLSLGGNQRNQLFRNNGDGSFTEIGYMAGVDSIEDGYMPAFADVDNDGRLDLLVRNCDPGTKHYEYPSLLLYKNQSTNKNSLSVSLVGVESNADAVGAKVQIRIGDDIQVREIDTVSGAAQSEMVAYFGLGKSTLVDEVRITWPSGQVDVHTNVDMGSIQFTEGM